MICALLIWFDETAATLDRAVSSALASGCGALAALDGRFESYTAGLRSPTSPRRQRARIARVCEDAGVPYTIEAPAELWPHEMAKRTALFRLGETLTTGADWFFVIDADVEVVAEPVELWAALAQTTRAAAEITCVETDGKPPHPLRTLYRAERGITVAPNHYTYRAADGRLLWNASRNGCVPAADLTGVVTQLHHPKEPARRASQNAYYRERDRTGLERGPCARCGERSVCLMLDDFQLDRRGRATGGYAEVCAACLPWYAERNGRIAAELGIPVAWAVRARNKTGDIRERVEQARSATV